MAAYLQCVRMLPPSMVPSFDAKVRRKDGVHIPVMLHISALRDAVGELTGMVAVAVDQSANMHREQAQRESQERYRDLFEHSSEMIATLSPAAQFLYANPAWKRCFGLDQTALLDLRSFEELFSERRPERGGRALPPRAGWRDGGPRSAAPPHAGRARAGTGIEPEPAAEGGQIRWRCAACCAT